ncbi:MAG: transglycosylase domain-containing protein [Rhodothermales bacterium]|nr:transglycosylase domain-containing protein [Rhodothermales bacterium]MBO6781084.1 transglycosylase domain-containing protein [Rhodothermales bacterium]
MSDWKFSDDEVRRFMEDPDSRKPRQEGSGGRLGAFLAQPEPRRAAIVLGTIVGLGLITALSIFGYMFSLRDELPPLNEIENPDFQLATIAYTADGEELARFASQNRAWITFDTMSPHLITALVATEDKRFYEHWGMDLWRTASAVTQTILGKVGLPFETQGGSTITQQLARNLYNTRIGRRQTVSRKLKEMVTAVQLEQRYTKQEIIEMYLNTVEFGYNIYGVETASRTFFHKSAADLALDEAAVLVGMLKGTTIYNPYRYPERAQRRRNVVYALMMDQGLMERAAFDTLRTEPVEAFNSSFAITSSIAPYFAQHVKEWMERWGRENGYDVFEDGLVVHTTLDSRMQEMANLALRRQADCLQAAVDFQWSRSSERLYSDKACDYSSLEDYTPFEYYWQAHPEYMEQMIRESPRFRQARANGEDGAALLSRLRGDQVFLDSLKAVKTRLEAGMVAMHPNTGHVKVWIGGRDLATDWFDHVDKAARQPGSTFKPFLYTAAIDNGWSPFYTLLDDSLHYVVDQETGEEWNPTNDGSVSGQMITLRDALARSMNTISARLILEVGPPQVAFIARVMGVTSPLAEVPALALGTSDVTLYEMTTAYATLANGGFRIDPIVVTSIEDAQGNVLYEAEQTPRQALSPETAYTMVDMLRGVVNRGTGQRMRSQFGMSEYDLGGKTGTTQNSADGWFISMHPDLVTGAWVGFNDRRVTFRTDWWGQGAHNALLVVGDFHQQLKSAGGEFISADNRFPPPPVLYQEEISPLRDLDNRRLRDRVGW